MNSWPEWKRFEALNRALDELLALPSDEREPIIARWRSQDPEEAILLERLLAAADTGFSSFDKALGQALHNVVAARPSALNEQLGDWQLTQWLGRGGMAEVWLATGSAAHQDQRAAIKRLAPELATPELIARFEQERKILAALDDPRIARLLDGGVTADGRPWLAMEYVAGQRIDAWCDAHRLGIAARVTLLREVSIAVHSAHRALIVHRDIKPANVMVTTDGHVKLLDFGIAKLLNPEQPHAAGTHTHTRSRLLTPQYASPEQLLGATITTGADVYQLGLLMVELLAGVRPFQSRSENLIELAHAIINQDAPAPSQALKRCGLSSAEVGVIAYARRTSAKRLRRQLRGDLDAIAQCALARTPSQRYASAMQFAEDLDAWLAQRPVRARAPSLSYRLRRFLSRNWLASSVAAALILVLGAYVGTVLLQSARIQRETELNRLVRGYLVELLIEADPQHSRTSLSPTKRMIDQAMARARTRFATQPEALAQLLSIGAEVETNHGRYTRAAELIGEALTLRRGLDPSDPRLTVVMGQYGRALHYNARYAEAEAVLREAESRWYGHGPSGTAWIPMALADVLHSRGAYADAEAVLRRADAAQLRANSSAVAQADVARELGTVLRDSGRMAEARTLQYSALAQMQHLLGASHGNTVATQALLARTLVLNGEAAAGRAQAKVANALIMDRFGAHHAAVGINRHTMALADELDGHIEDAASTLDEVLAVEFADVAPGNVLPAYAQTDRAWLRLALNRDTEAMLDINAAEAVLWPIRDGGHPRWAGLQLARAVLAVRRGDFHSARAAIGRAIAQREAQFGADNPFTIEARRWLLTLDRGAAPAPAANALRLEVLRLRLLLPSSNQTP